MICGQTCDELYHFTFYFWDTFRIPTDQVSPSQTLRCPGACDFQFLPTGLHGLCFGFCFAGPLPLRSLTHGPLLRVHFGESLVIDYTQKSTISTLAVKLSVSAIIYPCWTATHVYLLGRDFFSDQAAN